HVTMWPCGHVVKDVRSRRMVLPRSKAVESTLSGKLVRMACISWSEMGQPLEVCDRRVITTLRLESICDALALLLLGPGVGLEIALRRPAALAISRAPDNDVVVDHPSVSRHHARIHVHDSVALEGLSATNPVRFGGHKLRPGDRVAIAPGESFGLGALVGVVQSAQRPHPPPSRLVPPGAIIADPAMIYLYDRIALIAPSDVPVLVLGETGVGKDVAAQALHLGSARAQAPFVRINCGALPASLVESELFGNERGAFTGADRDKIGLLASATGGSVFFDE